MRRSLLSAAAVLGFVASASPAGAAVTLVSTEVKTLKKGFTTEPMPSTYYEVTGPGPFPNDADNFARVGPEGLTVGVNLIGSYSRSIGNYRSESLTHHEFKVRFDLDEPAPFTYSQRFTVFNISVDGVTTLQRDGDTPILLKYSGSGTLAPGHYTMSGDTDLESYFGFSGPERFVGVSSSYADVRLTVLPEPSTAGVLAGAMVILRRRRRSPS